MLEKNQVFVLLQWLYKSVQLWWTKGGGFWYKYRGLRFAISSTGTDLCGVGSVLPLQKGFSPVRPAAFIYFLCLLVNQQFWVNPEEICHSISMSLYFYQKLGE